MDDLRYPIGKFQPEGEPNEERRRQWIDEIAQTPDRLRAAVFGLSDEQIDSPYRPGGWTVRQVVHHLADSHINSYVRFRLALTEPEPTIKPYQESLWAELPDAASAPIEASLELMDALHERWVMLLLALTPQEFRRTFRHPERGLMTLEDNLALYAWHGRHHVAHITALRERMGWK